jgi:serine/threonine protein phosphatase PrpC
VNIKSAWCGDSRAVMVRDFDIDRTLDLSTDHKAGLYTRRKSAETHSLQAPGFPVVSTLDEHIK